MNILFITADQWRGECLSRTGHPHVKTPHLDRLAADGIAFKNHFAQATPCGPSRACLYTGMYLQNNRSLLNGTPLDSRHSNIALEARKYGYDPMLFGYTDVSLDPRTAEDSSFVEGGYEGILPGMTAHTPLNGNWELWLADLKEKGYTIPQSHWDMLAPRPRVDGASGKGKTFAPAPYKTEDSPTAFLVDRAASYISEAQADANAPPWFVHLSFYAPHPPFIASAPFNEMYDADDMPLPIRRDTPQEEAAQHPWLAYYLNNQRGKYYTHGTNSKDNLEISDQELRQIRATYYGMISEVDMQIGRLLEHLRQLACYDNTLIIFTSDHGEYLGDHWMFAKYGYFNQSFHIPLIMRVPGAEADQTRGSLVDAFSEGVDIFPTILDVIGGDQPTQCDGASLLPFCHAEPTKGWRQAYHAEYDLRSPYEIDEAIPLGLDKQHCAVNIIADEHYKYVHFNGLPALFFDLKNDPDEFHNVATDPDYQERVLEYAQKMLNWRMEHDEPALTHLHLMDSGEILNLQDPPAKPGSFRADKV